MGISNRQLPNPRAYRVLCLCGSMRFWPWFQKVATAETRAGWIVLTPMPAGEFPVNKLNQTMRQLWEMQCRRIEMADEILVVNVNGYQGENTRREVSFAKRLKKPVRYLEPAEASDRWG